MWGLFQSGSGHCRKSVEKAVVCTSGEHLVVTVQLCTFLICLSWTLGSRRPILGGEMPLSVRDLKLLINVGSLLYFLFDDVMSDSQVLVVK